MLKSVKSLDFVTVLAFSALTCFAGDAKAESFSIDGKSLNTNNSFSKIDGEPRISHWMTVPNDPDQDFERIPGNKGGTLLKHKSTGKCMNAYRKFNGAQFNVWGCNLNDPDQNWQVNSLGGGAVQLKLAGTNLCADMSDRNNGGKTHLWTCDTNNGNQRWQSNAGRNAGGIFSRVNNAWQIVPGTAFDVAIGGNNSTWVIGSNPLPGGYGIYRWTGSQWQGIDGGAVGIAVDPSGNPWVVNSSGSIFRRVNNTWQGMPGTAKDIEIGRDGSVWIIGTNSVPGGYGIYRWTGSTWQNVAGGAVRIAVDNNGNPWVVNSNGHIFQRVNENWQLRPGLAKDIAIGHDNSVWVIGMNPVPGGYGIYRWTGSTWQNIDGGAVRVAVNNSGAPWVVNDPGQSAGSPPQILDWTKLGTALYQKTVSLTGGYGAVLPVWCSVYSDCKHPGVDYASSHQSPIYSPISGIVNTVSTGKVGVYNQKSNATFFFYHLDSTAVTQGQSISVGTIIGRQGNRGYATGSHLHFEAVNGNRTRMASSFSDSRNPLDAVNQANAR